MDRPTPIPLPYRVELSGCLLLGGVSLVSLVAGPAMVVCRALVAWVREAVSPALPVLVGLVAVGIAAGGRRADPDASSIEPTPSSV